MLKTKLSEFVQMANRLEMTTNEFLAVELFGWSFHRHDGLSYWKTADGQRGPTPEQMHWEDSWEGAGQVIEAMRAKGFKEFRLWDSGGAEYFADFRDHQGDPKWSGYRADIAPKAIAEAARAALEER